MGETALSAAVTMEQLAVGRGIFSADLGAVAQDREWMIEVLLPGAQGAGGEAKRLFAPPGAPAHWQSVVVMN
jgi:hypothetical protein